MNQSLNNTAQVLQIIHHEIDVMQSLAQLLEEEQLVLIDNESDKLEVITPNKNSLLSKVVELEKSRSQVLAQLGLSNDAVGMSQFLAMNSHNAELELAWKSLLAISSAAQEQNKNNGQLINRQLSKNQAALNVLQSGSAHQAGSMYGADGQSKVKSNANRGIVAG
ncbi:flagellar protein FlgN [Undibacterium amnicola]|uniref:Flagellar protein FlgN n=1 Tax=Undibacterium amnicola TaxID=1834038 RepID=A0ABR6XLH2_9BURK|nr:flagellar protein FlgN [Undibacterium amnicola]MBC3830366.1 flagellar protein FlgN [Undibacterium amnicola]